MEGSGVQGRPGLHKETLQEMTTDCKVMTSGKGSGSWLRYCNLESEFTFLTYETERPDTHLETSLEEASVWVFMWHSKTSSLTPLVLLPFSLSYFV